MNAEEKAKELVEKFKPYMYPFASGSAYLTGERDEQNIIKEAKQCALIAVDEILNILFQHHEIDLLEQVKEEIKKL